MLIHLAPPKCQNKTNELHRRNQTEYTTTTMYIPKGVLPRTMSKKQTLSDTKNYTIPPIHRVIAHIHVIRLIPPNRSIALKVSLALTCARHHPIIRGSGRGSVKARL